MLGTYFTMMNALLHEAQINAAKAEIREFLGSKKVYSFELLPNGQVYGVVLIDEDGKVLFDTMAGGYGLRPSEWCDGAIEAVETYIAKDYYWGLDKYNCDREFVITPVGNVINYEQWIQTVCININE